MNWMIRRYSINVSSLILAVVFLGSCNKPVEVNSGSRVEKLPYYKDAYFTPHWLGTEKHDLDTFHKISSFQFTNQEGLVVTDKTFADKIYVADFFFASCPGICPKMTANMSILQEEFKADNEVLLLSHSVTPDRDSVSVLKEYGELHGIDSKKWHLVTGDQNEIYKLGRKDYFVEEDLGAEKEIDEFLHTENFVLIDKNKHIRGIYSGLNKSSINQLILDIKALKEE